MKILAIDIGAGTEDVLLYDDKKSNIENCVKMVLPSPCQVFAKKVKNATCEGNDLFVRGDTIGGGPLSYALKLHVKAGYNVYMTERAAYTVRNSLTQVKHQGIKIVSNSGPKNFKGITITLQEININKIKNFLNNFEESFLDIDYVAIAVQDHGIFPEETTNRQFRINKIQELLKKNPKPESFAFKGEEVPLYYPRMRSAVCSAKKQLPDSKIIIMDTSPDAILGCLMDSSIQNIDPLMAVNLGNGHTMAAIISKAEINAVLEHHTRLLNPEKLGTILKDFANGKISNEQIFNDNGHGMFYLKSPLGFSNIKKIVVTGPNRNILSKRNLPIHFASPGGDVMMTGPIGLIEATKRRFVNDIY